MSPSQRRMPILLAALILCLAPAAASGVPPEREARLLEGMRAMSAGDLSTALRLLGGLDDMALEAGLLEARAQLNAGRLDAAAAAYRAVQARAPAGSPAATRARFGLAECLARKGDFEAAERLFAEALDGVQAQAQSGTVARRLMLLGDERLEPAAPGKAAEPARAEQLFRAALELAVEPALQAEIERKIGLSLVKQERHGDAAAWYQQLLQRKPPPPRPDELQLHAAESLIKQGDTRGARRHLRDLLAAEPRSAHAAEATWLLSRTHGMPAPGSGAELALGQAALRHFLATYPLDKRASDARLEIALAPLKRGQHASAEEELRALLAAGKPEEILAPARYHLGVALAAQGRHDEAVAAFQEYLEHHPAHEFWAQARRGIEDARAAKAQAAELAKRWSEAAVAFEDFADKHPASAFAPTALLRAAGARVQAEDLDGALRVLSLLTAKFAQDAAGCQGWLLAGEIHERRGDMVRVKEAYQKARGEGKSPCAGEADQRLAQLELPSLLIESPENFRSDHRPRLTLRARNITGVEVRAYRLVAEDFFRDRFGFDALTEVDIALCSPDLTWSIPIAGYRPLARHEQKVELPLEQPGLYLLGLGAGKLEATTAVLVSDLALVAKAGYRELFVFAEDLRELAPARGARVLVSDGSRIVGEGETDAQGALRVALPEELGESDLQVFASRGDHLAWLGGVSPLDSPPEILNRRALVLSDRPVYRPGEIVHLAGVFRDAKGGKFSPAAGAKLGFLLRDAAGHTLLDEDVTLDEFGVFTRALALEPDAPAGSYTATLTHPEGDAFSARFQVESHRRLPYDLEVRLDKPVVHRGEPARGTLTVRHTHGALAPDMEVLFWYDGAERVETARTDAQGRMTFSFPTREFEENRTLVLHFRLPGTFQEAEARVLVAAADLRLRLETGRETLFAGQPFELFVYAEGPDGGPRGARARLEVLAQVQPTLGERREQDLTVDVPAQGLARVPLRLAQAGGYVLRLRAQDGAGEPVVAELAVTAQGADEPRLSLEVDRPVQTLGHPAKLVLQSTLPARALVLITVETERVLEHRALLVAPGQTAFEVPVHDALAPSFQVAAAALDGDKLRHTSRSLEVSRELQVEIRADHEEVGPGEEVQLTVVARDQDGRPADAEFILSVVDEALLEAYPDLTPTLKSVFERTRVLGEIVPQASNTHRFPDVEAAEVEQAEIEETQGSAAMAALSSRRRAMTEHAIGEFDALAERESLGFGGLGTVGSGSGGSGMGMGAGYGRSAKVMMGKGGVLGGKEARWRRAFEEGALFRADVRTGPDGVAGLTVRLPDSLSRWRVTARGVTRDTLVGQAQRELRTAQPFWARLDLPPELESGDRVTPVARLFNDTTEARRAALRLTVGGKTQEAALEVPARGVAAHAFAELAAGEAGQPLELSLEAQAGPLADRLKLSVPVRPRGVRVEVATQGRLEGREKRSLILAEGLREPRLGLRVGTRLSSFFLGDCHGCSPSAVLGGRGPDAALVDLSILDLLGPDADATTLAGVRTRLRAELAWLVSAHNSDGGWGWSADGATSLEVTAAAVEALARARGRAAELGFLHPQAELDAAAQLLQSSLAGLPPEDFQRRAEILHALAHLGEASVPAVQLHRLHRLRRELGMGAQALLGLAWIALNRPEQAAEVAAAIADPLAEFPPGSPWERWSSSGWVSDLDRARALLLLGLVNPADPRVARATAWLHAGGRSLGWSSPRLAAVALRAIARLEAVRGPGGRLRVALRLNGQPAGEAELTGPAALAEIEVEPRLIRPGANELELSLEGGGPAWFVATLSGQLLEGPAKPEGPIALSRRVEPVPAAYRGQPIEAGFDVVVPTTKRWTHAVARMPAGTEVDVIVELERKFDAPLDHCVLEERVPAGFALQPGAERGDFTHLRAEGRRLFFHLRAGGKRMHLRYRLTAVEPGAYAFPPLRLVSLPHPEIQALGPGTAFAIDPAGADRPPTRPTPDELHARGLLAAKMEDHAVALADLEALWGGFELRAENVPGVLEHLLFSAIALQDPARILKYFELTKERNPDLVVPFEKIAPVQDAYRKLKAHEGGLHLDRGLAEALFLRQIRTVGALEAEDEVAEAMALLRRILGSFPDLNVAARAAYAFSQVLYGRADKAAEGETVEGFDRPGLLQEVERFMAGFLALFPDDPEAPPAIYSLASALLEADRAAPAAEWCAVGLARHKESDLAPAIAYLKAFAHFRLGQYAESLALCRRVADEASQEEHRNMARYIMAQIHHARGELEKAEELYALVRETFRDARETLEELSHQSLAVQDVVVVPPGEPPRLPVSATNVKEVALRAYRVDLFKLYLVKRSLRDLAQVNLAGVKPIMNRTVRLAQGRAGPVEERLPLQVPGKGAYLVLARAGSQTLPSLVLVGGLTLEVTELGDEGRVRVTVRDARGRPQPGSRIQLKGEQNDRFQAGQADLRGVFLASGIQGPVTAIAQKDGAYGLYRGTLDIQGGEETKEETSGKRSLVDFGDDNIDGEIYNQLLEQQAMPAARANEFFNQDVKGMSAQQAK